MARTFLAVVRQRSFVAAGEEVGRTQAAVSQQIQRLEEWAGAPLLLRSSREVQLTPAGERFLDYARQLVAVSDAARRAVAGQVSRRSLRLGLSEDIACFALPALLQRLQQQAPDVQLDLATGATRDLLSYLGTRHDVVLGFAAMGQRGGQEIAQRPLRWYGHWPETSQPVPLLVQPDGCMMQRAAIAALDSNGRPWQIAVALRGIVANIAALRAGLGVATLVEGLAPADVPQITGLPQLPALSIRLYCSDEADSELVHWVGLLLGESLARLST
ncbi:LysR family transcriptional regulator [Parachitinimonas caeni]|uniref:LysR family transcriptional regulator n=1 Tax=Parachitinimonas caeni TaxID=3031301 RepID=A0ABT7E667_9NEIS|nr:LysR family transcriptional regulator [Parachitinimonas caeni]MDK2126848.1 LysR family transcriptional regulator [Parachitinimonas caeni]